MSRKQEGPRFIFHGNAMPFGGRIEAVSEIPQYELIKGPPSAALPVTGGWSIATSAGSHHRDWFQWGASVADCKGEWLGGQHYLTTVISSIADLSARNEPHVFEADYLRIKMISEHTGPDHAPHIVPREIVFGGLRLNRHPITVNYDHDFADFPTLTQFEQEYQKSESFFKKYQACLRHPFGAPTFGDPLPRTPGGYVAASFVRSVTWNGEEHPGHVLQVQGFGNIYFGEVLLNADNRRVTMVRLAMGCSLQASASGPEGDPNGTWTN